MNKLLRYLSPRNMRLAAFAFLAAASASNASDPTIDSLFSQMVNSINDMKQSSILILVTITGLTLLTTAFAIGLSFVRVRKPKVA